MFRFEMSRLSLSDAKEPVPWSPAVHFALSFSVAFVSDSHATRWLEWRGDSRLFVILKHGFRELFIYFVDCLIEGFSYMHAWIMKANSRLKTHETCNNTKLAITYALTCQCSDLANSRARMLKRHGNLEKTSNQHSVHAHGELDCRYPLKPTGQTMQYNLFILMYSGHCRKQAHD